MKPGFLDALDMALSGGMNSLSESFTDRIKKFVVEQQMPDGGYRGRLGGSDLYYTDFAARILSLLSSDNVSFDGIHRWITTRQPEPHNIVECFNILNIRRILGKFDISILVDENQLKICIQSQELSSGGFSRPGGRQISAYNTFLASLCFQMLDYDYVNLNAMLSALYGLSRPDGGYSETSGESISQTNATAAAVACLMMHESLDADDRESALKYLISMQSSEGGLLAQPSASEEDLLSTYTGMVCMFGLDGFERMNLTSTAKYVRNLMHHDGGFRACLSDGEADVEYTYYGLGVLALLRVYLLAQDEE
ncbi:MAG: prenyltransferase/squalene oxidase repeat-containing protein [Armatimonadota bacterium]